MAQQPDFNIIDAYEIFDEKKKGFIHIHDLKSGLDKLGAGYGIKLPPPSIHQNIIEEPKQFFYKKIVIGQKIQATNEQLLPP